MSKREEKLRSFATHPWFKRVYVKLSASDLDIINTFIKDNDYLNQDAFEMKVNRMFLDNPNKPKNWAIIIEILTSIS